MRYWIKSSLMQLIAFSSIFSPGCGSTSSVDGVYLKQTVVDLGDVSETSSPKATVTIVNGSGRPVRVSQLVLSCGCLESDFAAATIGSGDELDCTVTLAEPSPGEGKQYGRFVTEQSLMKPLAFELSYHVREASYLHPETQILGSIRLVNTTWPLEITFQVMGLDDTVKLLEPLTVEGESAFHYEISNAEFAPGGLIKLEMSHQGESVGFFSDRIVIVGKTTDGMYRYPVNISGSILGDH